MQLIPIKRMKNFFKKLKMQKLINPMYPRKSRIIRREGRKSQGMLRLRQKRKICKFKEGLFIS